METEYSADFEVEVVDDVVVIFDLDRGNRSVTNDITSVLKRVSRSIGGVGSRPVIYRDSTKTFDGVRHEGDRFVGFYPIGEKVLESAIRRARQTT